MQNVLNPRQLFLQSVPALAAAIYMLSAQAAPARPFDEAAFRKVQQEGKAILVEVRADRSASARPCR